MKHTTNTLNEEAHSNAIDHWLLVTNKKQVKLGTTENKEVRNTVSFNGDKQIEILTQITWSS